MSDDDLRAIVWDGGRVRLIDQTRLPGELVLLDIDDVDTMVDAIARLAVRGAPALGAAGALGVVLALQQAERENWDVATRDAAIGRIRTARPTAVNLAWGVDRVLQHVPLGRDAVLADALALIHEDEQANRAIGRSGADWIQQRFPGRPIRVLTHCNTGMLATTAWGTALGIVRELAARDAIDLVYVDETRPLLQGSRLTAWELAQERIAHRVQADGAAASTILRGLVDVAIIGADRIAANGDTANKIGSVGVALACADAGVPFLVAAPASTVDPATRSGDEIEIEERPAEEVTFFGAQRTAPEDSPAFNPAFDVTPARLISAIVTEVGAESPAELETRLRAAVAATA
ncbi:MAG: S-methyl-5-thioribose-1-phosphate isomerase [Nitriliruptor sp.]|nr:MAG: S-methyl-5-thioribose-1-phosphate isomerase [Nitriliruptor sp.]